MMSATLKVVIASVLLCLLAVSLTQCETVSRVWIPRNLSNETTANGINSTTRETLIVNPGDAVLFHCLSRTTFSRIIRVTLEEIENCMSTIDTRELIERAVGVCLGVANSSIVVELQATDGALGTFFNYVAGETYYFTSFSPWNADVNTAFIFVEPNQTQCRQHGLQIAVQINSPVTDSPDDEITDMGNSTTTNSAIGDTTGTTNSSIPDDGGNNGPGNVDGSDDNDNMNGPGDGGPDVGDIGGLGGNGDLLIGPGEIAAIVVVLVMAVIFSVILVIVVLVAKFGRSQKMSPNNKSGLTISTRVNDSYRKIDPSSPTATLERPPSVGAVVIPNEAYGVLHS